MSAPWYEQPFAEEVARALDGDSILFRVVTPLAQYRSERWSEPVIFRFFEREDGTYELRMIMVDLGSRRDGEAVSPAERAEASGG